MTSSSGSIKACPKCSAFIRPGGVFCSNCGYRFDSPTPPPAGATPPRPIPEAAPLRPSPVAYWSTTAPSEPRRISGGVHWMLLFAFLLLFITQFVALSGDLGWQADAAAAESASAESAGVDVTADESSSIDEGSGAEPSAADATEAAADADAVTDDEELAWYDSTGVWRLIVVSHLLALGLLAVLMAIWLSQAIAALAWLRTPARFTPSQGAMFVLIPVVNLVLPPIVLADVFDKSGRLRPGAATSSGTGVAAIWWAIVLIHLAGVVCTMSFGLLTSDDFSTLLMPDVLGLDSWPNWVYLATDLSGIVTAIVGTGIFFVIHRRQAGVQG